MNFMNKKFLIFNNLMLLVLFIVSTIFLENWTWSVILLALFTISYPVMLQALLMESLAEKPEKLLGGEIGEEFEDDGLEDIMKDAEKMMEQLSEKPEKEKEGEDEQV